MILAQPRKIAIQRLMLWMKLINTDPTEMQTNGKEAGNQKGQDG